MVNHRYKRAVLGITTALVVSACTVPAMAAPITINTDQSISVVSTDSTYVGGLDLEARIITTVEQDQRSPYAKKGIAVADDYLKIHTEPNGDAEVVGKLYSGSGCEIEEVKDGWAHITSGDCDGYVEAKYLLTGTDAEAYAEEHKVSELVAKSQSEQMYMYEEPSADAKIVTTVLWDQELTVLGASDDGQWVQVKVGDNTGYIPADSVVLDVKYEEAVSVDEEQTNLRRQRQKQRQRLLKLKRPKLKLKLRKRQKQRQRLLKLKQQKQKPQRQRKLSRIKNPLLLIQM